MFIVQHAITIKPLIKGELDFRLEEIVCMRSFYNGEGGKEKPAMRKIRRVGANQKQSQEQPSVWVIDMHNDIKKGLVCDSGTWWTIYRVPKNMRGIHRNAFVPKSISIGPFHYRDPGLRIMEQHKMRLITFLMFFAPPTCSESMKEQIQLDGSSYKPQPIFL